MLNTIYYALDLLVVLLMALPALSVVTLFYVLVSMARLLLEKLEERIGEIIVKSNSSDPGEDDELGLSVELDEWRRQYELVSRWIDQLDSCFGFLILVQLISFASYSFFYFWKLLLTYSLLAIHVRYDVDVMAEKAEEIEYLIGRPLLGDFPLGDQHILNAMFFCHLCSRLLPNMLSLTVNLMASWLRLLIILIPTYRMQNQVSCC